MRYSLHMLALFRDRGNRLPQICALVLSTCGCAPTRYYTGVPNYSEHQPQLGSVSPHGTSPAGCHESGGSSHATSVWSVGDCVYEVVPLSRALSPSPIGASVEISKLRLEPPKGRLKAKNSLSNNMGTLARCFTRTTAFLDKNSVVFSVATTRGDKNLSVVAKSQDSEGLASQVVKTCLESTTLEVLRNVLPLGASASFLIKADVRSLPPPQ